MRSGLERLQSHVLTVAAVVIAVAFVHREFFGGPQVLREPIRPPQTVREWRDILPAGRVVGDSTAPVKVVEFADLECPFCKRFNATLHTLNARYANRVAIVFVHLPLPMHRFADLAAHAAECAAPANRFWEMVDVLYEKQDSLGLKPWVGYAALAGVQDTSGFSHCLADTVAVPKIARGIATAKAFHISATPTVFVNSLRFGTVPTDSELYRAIDRALAGGQY